MPQIRVFKNTLKLLTKYFLVICKALLTLTKLLYNEINAMELLFIRLPNLYPFTCQLLFFMLCEMVLNDSTSPNNATKFVAAMTTILLYSIGGYFVSKIRSLCTGETSLSFRVRSFRDCLKYILKILVEWLKAVMIAICLREQGLNYKLEKLYTSVTLSYYICTEGMFLRLLASGLSLLCLDFLDSMEYIYLAIIFNAYAILVTLVFTCMLFQTKYLNFALSAGYFTVYLRLKDLYWRNYKVLVLERSTFGSFKKASSKEIEEWNDICAVCLNTMSRARITPCKHLFHPKCLKQCLLRSFQCPLCKQSFLH